LVGVQPAGRLGVPVLRTDDAGYAVLPSLFPPEECALWDGRLGEVEQDPHTWFKGHGASSRTFYDLATDYRIVSVVSQALGSDDILLWSASLAVREPGQAHPWHCDVEAWGEQSRSVSVWIGLRNCTPMTALSMLSGSHRFPSPVQELAAREGIKREDVDDAIVGTWAGEFDREASAIDHLHVYDGDAIVFDGNMWHRSAAMQTESARVAVLLQYTLASSAVRMPDLTEPAWTWPFRFTSYPRIPCVRVAGFDAPQRGPANLVVAPPPNHGADAGERLHSSTTSLQLPLVPLHHEGWMPFPVLRGLTNDLDDLSCHVSVLSQGACPHLPHQHPEEEILLVLSGRAELTLPALAGANATQELSAGEFVYYPAGFWHTLTGVSTEPVHYLMIKWFGDRTHAGPALGHVRSGLECEPTRTLADSDDEGFKPALLFEQPTGILDALHCHVSILEPGAGYAPHADEYEVVLVLLEGEIETLGRRVTPVGVVHYAAGEEHGIHNPGTTPARYLVFELHGSPGARGRLRREGVLSAQGDKHAAVRESGRRPSKTPALSTSARARRALRRLRAVPYRIQDIRRRVVKVQSAVTELAGQQADLAAKHDAQEQRLVGLLDEIQRDVRSLQVTGAAVAEQVSWSGRSQPRLDGPLVSVVSPVHNRSGEMGRAVASLLAQTYPNWECCIVDDGSIDIGEADLARWQRDSRIRVVRQPRSGVGGARNRAIAETTGEIITYLDSDNWWLPTYLERVVETFTTNPDVLWTHSAQLIIEGDVPRVRPDRAAPETLADVNFIDLNVAAHRRSVLSKIEGPAGFDETFPRYGDWELFQRIFAAVGAPTRISAVGGVYTTSSANRISDQVPEQPYLEHLRTRMRRQDPI